MFIIVPHYFYLPNLFCLLVDILVFYCLLLVSQVFFLFYCSSKLTYNLKILMSFPVLKLLTLLFSYSLQDCHFLVFHVEAISQIFCVVRCKFLFLCLQNSQTVLSLFSMVIQKLREFDHKN